MLEKLYNKQKELETRIAALYAEAEREEAKLDIVNEMIDEEVKAKAATPSIATDKPENGAVTIRI
jgi:uncharacterized small protein (DUF1192 family)